LNSPEQGMTEEIIEDGQELNGHGNLSTIVKQWINQTKNNFGMVK
jgi:hypothetical protein